MKRIPLTQEKFTLVDDEDYEEIKKYKWWLVSAGYAGRKIGNRKNRKPLYLHRYILKAPKGTVVDHLNGNKLDNQKSNIRICTQSHNLQNKKITKNSTSKYRGVSWSEYHKKWHSRICFKQKKTHVGYFDNEKIAAAEYDRVALKIYGENAYFNFRRP